MTLSPQQISAKIQDNVCEEVVRTLALNFRPREVDNLRIALAWEQTVGETELDSVKKIDSTHMAKELAAAAKSLRKAAASLRTLNAVEEVKIALRVLTVARPPEKAHHLITKLPRVMESNSIPQILDGVASFWETFAKHQKVFFKKGPRNYARRLPLLLYAKEKFGPNFSVKWVAEELRACEGLTDSNDNMNRLGLEAKTLRTAWKQYQEGYLPETTRLLEALWASWSAKRVKNPLPRSRT